ncbi:PD40 domain-containing protein [candidate division KSB1 bacterium]|nr:PD40 domain-containing protein [candidate division KSB1 bacterium]
MKRIRIVLACLVMIWVLYRSFVRNPDAEIEPANNVQPPITTTFIRNGSPSWSPDGEKIIFYSDRNGNDEIYIMNEDERGWNG